MRLVRLIRLPKLAPIKKIEAVRRRCCAVGVHEVRRIVVLRLLEPDASTDILKRLLQKLTSKLLSRIDFCRVFGFPFVHWHPLLFP